MKKIFPTELIEFLQCRHMARLRSLGVLPDSSVSEEILLLREKGLEHEKNFLETLEGTVVSIDTELSPPEQKQQTLKAMNEGADWIYQAYLQAGDCAGYSDFLQKKRGSSNLGEHYYEVIDTKLANQPSPANAIQLIHYSELVCQAQGRQPDKFHLVHGDSSKTTLERSDIIDYYHEILSDYKNFIQGKEFTEPHPIPACKQCGYRDHCQNYLQDKNHLALIPGISITEIQHLHKGGIKKVESCYHSEAVPSTYTESSFKDLQKAAESVQQNSYMLKNQPAFNQLQNSLKDSLFFSIHRNFQQQNGAMTFFMGIMTDQERYESVVHHNAQEEKQSLQRMVNFISRYLAKYPHAKLVVSHAQDARLLHDLSNLYNICHDELDELMIKKRIVAIQSLFQQSFIFPLWSINCQELLSILKPDFEAHPLLEKSPQLLYELYTNLNIEDSLQQIHQKTELELKVNIECFKKLCALTADDFPLLRNRPRE